MNISGDFMNKKTSALILKILRIALSIILCVTATVSMLGATLINVARDYLQSEDFHALIDTTDLGTVKFMVNNEKITANEYVYMKASDFLKDKIPSFVPFGNIAVEKVLSSEMIDKELKAEIYNLIDYFLNSDVKEAKDRIKNDIVVENEISLENSENIEVAIRAYAHNFVLKSIENTIGMSNDYVIVLLSQQTMTKLVMLSVVLLIILVVINLKTIFDTLLYGGLISFAYAITIKAAQGKFESMNEGMQDLVGYVFLKPLADSYSMNAIIGFLIGIVLIALFAGAYFLFKNFVNKEKTEE